MTCESTRELLLTADLGELRGEGAGALAAHLQGCPECRAAAERILHSTSGLGGALRSRRHRRTAAGILPFAVAAGLALMFWPRTASVAPAPASTASAPVTAAGASVRVAVAPPPPRRTVLVEPRPIVPVALTPVAFVPRPVVDTTAPVAAAPRKHPTALVSSDPDITVYWLD